MDILGGQRWILGGGRKLGSSWVGELIATSSFIVAREQSIAVNEKARIDLQMKISIDNRPSPMGVVINLLDDSTFYGISNPQFECSFWTDFGDTGATFNNISSELNRNDANQSPGWVTGHVYAVDDEFTAVSMCKHFASGALGFAVHTFTVLDADTFYAGTKTVCLDPSNVFSDAPAGSQKFITWSAARSAMLSLGDDARLMLAKGQSHEVNFDTSFRMKKGCQYTSFGTGADPIVTANIKPNESGVFHVFLSDYRAYETDGSIIFGLDFQGNYDPITGIGESRRLIPVEMIGANSLTVWKNKISGTSIAIYPKDDVGNNKLIDQVLICDNHISDWHDLPIIGAMHNSVIIGNSIKQNPLAVSGPGNKLQYTDLIDGDGVTLTYTLDRLAIFGDVANLAVFDYDTINDTLTPLTITTDFTFTEGVDASPSSSNGTHSLTLTSAIDIDHQLFYMLRQWARHGPIRLAVPDNVTICKNELENYAGWSSDGAVHQSCTRWNSDGTSLGGGLITMNKMTGGWETLVVQPANTSIRQYPTNPLVIEQNEFVGTDNTKTFIGLASTNILIRNNFGIKSDVQNTYGAFSSFVRAARYTDATLTDVDANDIHLINNTIANLTSAANGAVDTVILEEPDDANNTPFANVNEFNNLLHMPDRPTPLPINYSPLDEGNYYRPKSGSPAIDAGTPSRYVFDDFFGLLVGETASIGAADGVDPEATQYTYDIADESAATGLPSFLRAANNSAAYTSFIESGDRPEGGAGNLWRVKITTNPSNVAFIIDEIGTTSGDVEVLTLTKGNDTYDVSSRFVIPRPATRIKEYEDSTPPDWVHGGARPGSTEIRIRSAIDGTMESNAAVSGGPTILEWDENWYYTRVKQTASGTVSVKVWQYGTTEPASYQLNFTDESNRISGEHVGIAGYNSSTVMFAYMSVGLDGEPAPML